jgi:hypothetical protein
VEAAEKPRRPVAFEEKIKTLTLTLSRRERGPEKTMLDIALKEWAIVCDLLVEGRLALLLRKGGIHESGGPGVFELEHPRFLLFPSWAHQKPEMIKPEHRGRVQVLEEPETIPFRGLAEVARIWRVPTRAAFETLDDLHCWTSAQIDMRFNYRPENPLYLMAVRAYRLERESSVPNRPEYAGCKSWVPLRPSEAVEDRAARVVMSDDAFASVVNRVTSAFK